jgi:hypothetical protein
VTDFGVARLARRALRLRARWVPPRVLRTLLRPVFTSSDKNSSSRVRVLYGMHIACV